jgi:hypothetical protein
MLSITIGILLADGTDLFSLRVLSAVRRAALRLILVFQGCKIRGTVFGLNSLSLSDCCWLSLVSPWLRKIYGR